MTQKKQQSRRDFIKKSAYAAPVVISFSAMPAMAAPGSLLDDGPEGGKDQQDEPYIAV